MRARSAAIAGVLAALAVGAVAVARRQKTTELAPAVESTLAVRIVRRDRSGMPEKKGSVRDPARVRAITEALGVDVHPGGPCPPDYAEADFGIVLSGTSVYVKRNVYVFGLLGGDDAGAGDAGDAGDTGDAGDADDAGAGDAGGAPSVVSVTSAGCKVGPPADLGALTRELRAAGALE